MNIMLIDDDEAIRMMLQDIIEDYNLGTVVDALPSAATLDNALLAMRQIDILIIDMLMPVIDGIQAVSKIKAGFTGKILMLSQVESKDLVGKAYEDGVDYYITKPLNRNEIVSVLRMSVNICGWKASPKTCRVPWPPSPRKPLYPTPTVKQGIRQRGEAILKDMGIAGAPGTADLLDILQILDNQPANTAPSLKSIFKRRSRKPPWHDRCGQGVKSHGTAPAPDHLSGPYQPRDHGCR
ncbi:MAG: response regulator [Selenomonas sp.]|jgi:two-component system response regulator YcbB|nr:response regulator [Selenomonas sp.]